VATSSPIKVIIEVIIVFVVPPGFTNNDGELAHNGRRRESGSKLVAWREEQSYPPLSGGRDGT
jgi:hypothetical protein